MSLASPHAAAAPTAPAPTRATAAGRALAALRRPRTRSGRSLGRSLAFAGALALAGLAGSSRPAQAVVTEYETCLLYIDDVHRRCLRVADNWLADRVCDWAAGTGIMACAAAEAVRMLARGIAPPAF